MSKPPLPPVFILPPHGANRINRGGTQVVIAHHPPDEPRRTIHCPDHGRHPFTSIAAASCPGVQAAERAGMYGRTWGTADDGYAT